MRVRARGTKKSVSKLGGSLEPLMEVDLQLAHGRIFGVVTGSQIRNRFPKLREEVISLVAGQWLLELVEKITKPDQPSPEVYVLTMEGLDDLGKQTTAGHIWLSLLRTAWLLLRHEGFAPDLSVCAVCGQLLPKTETSFDPTRGFVHSREARADSITLLPPTLEFLQDHKLPSDVREVFRVVFKLVEHFIHQTFDQPLRSEKVLHRVMRQAQLSEQRQRGTLPA